MKDNFWRTSFRLSKESKRVIKHIAKDYRVSYNDVIEMILAGKINVPEVLAELKDQEDEQDTDT